MSAQILDLGPSGRSDDYQPAADANSESDYSSTDEKNNYMDTHICQELLLEQNIKQKF